MLYFVQTGAVGPAIGGGLGMIELMMIAGGLVVGIILGVAIVRLLTGQTMGRAKTEAAQIVKLAESEGETVKERASIEAKKKSMEERERLEAELRVRENELRETDRELGKRENLYERKNEAFAFKEKDLAKNEAKLTERAEAIGKREEELEKIIKKKKAELLRITDLTEDEAKRELFEMVEAESREEVAKIIRRSTESAENEAKEKAREITLMAIQRYASEHVAESTVRTVPIPSDDVKGRIIGREGRNIRAIEKATGADIIVDDTPGVIVVSCFDKVRQTIAAQSLMKLIEDGRIHPTRIEEVVEKTRKDIEEQILKHGKDAQLEMKIKGLHPKIVEAMGRLQYRTSYGQNVLGHSIEVGIISQLIADQLGLDGRIARRCGFLHDIGKAMDHEMEGGHPKIGMDFAKQYGESEPVLNAIGGHHADLPATSYYTPIVMAADAVSGARPGARRESLERYIQRLEQLQDIALSNEGVDEAYAIQAGREVRVMVSAAKVGDDEAHLIARKIADRVSEEMTFPGEIRVTVLRETRAVEIAR